jgi:aryl-alcohol dehydrogenase-like predicted oxidoreductase
VEYRTLGKTGIEVSLRRLDTDYIDLYQIHRFDEHTDLEEIDRLVPPGTSANGIDPTSRAIGMSRRNRRRAS